MFFFYIILLIGALTTFTDLKSKKIYNQHLIIGAILGLMAIVYASVFRHENVLYHIINGLIAFVIAFFLYHSALWKGGDAKLFTLYAFLMPPVEFGPVPFSSAVSLLASSFITGMTILTPAYIKDIITNRQIIVNELFSAEKGRTLFRAMLRVILFSWILFPIYYFLKVTHPIIMMTTMFICFSFKYNKHPKAPLKFFKRDYLLLTSGFAFGLLTRLLLHPDSMSFPALGWYLMIVTLSTAISTSIYSTFDHFTNSQERIPFAPLLFMGCLLSYTPFLTMLMQKMAQWNALRYH